MGQAEVVVGAGSYRFSGDGAVAFPHKYTDEGVTVRTMFTGAYLLHLTAAGCVLNDVYRESEGLGVRIDGVRVTASGEFERGADNGLRSLGISYQIEVDSPSPAEDVERLLAHVDAVAEMPSVIRAGAPVARARAAASASQ
jgi:hypothetical protein